MTCHHDYYIWGIAKLKVSEPVKDKIQIKYPNDSFGLAYLHYEKIKRICLFCGIMFHNMQHCPLRTNILRERSKRGLPVHDFPVQRYDQWIIDEDLVPLEAIRSSGITNVGHKQQQLNPVLTRLQRLFAKDLKGKEKYIEQLQIPKAPVYQGHYHPLVNSMEQWHGGRSTTLAPLSTTSGPLRIGAARFTDQLLPTQQQGTISITTRSSPALEHPPPNPNPAAPPLAKKFPILTHQPKYGAEQGTTMVSMQISPGEDVVAALASQTNVVAPDHTRVGNVGRAGAEGTEPEIAEAGATTPIEETAISGSLHPDAEGRPCHRPTGWDVPPSDRIKISTNFL